MRTLLPGVALALAALACAATLALALNAWLRAAAHELGPSAPLVVAFAAAASFCAGLGALRARRVARAPSVAWFQWGTAAVVAGFCLMLSPFLLSVLLWGHRLAFSGGAPAGEVLLLGWAALAVGLCIFPVGLSAMGAVALLCAAKDAVRGLAIVGCAAAAGAAAGLCAGELLVVPWAGPDGAAQFAGFVLALAGAASLGVLIVRWRAQGVAAAGVSPKHTPEPPVALGLLSGRSARAGMALGMGAACALAVPAGARALGLTFGPAPDSLLASFGALALGGAVGFALSPLLRRARPALAVAALLVALCAALVFATAALGRLPYAYLAIFQAAEGDHGALLLREVGLKCAVLAPLGLLAALLLCALPPLLRAEETDTPLAAAARATGFAAIGVAAGALAGALALPLFGAHGELLLCAALLGALAAGLLFCAGQRGYLLPLAIFYVGLLYFAAQAGRWDPRVSTSGVYATAPALVAREPVPEGEEVPTPAQRMLTREILAVRDGLFATASVACLRRPRITYNILQINGRTAASISDPTVAWGVGHLPLLLHKSPRRVLVLGLGAGFTLGAVLAYDEVQRAVCFEREAQLLWTAEFFSSANRGALADERAEVRVGPWPVLFDASQERFDVICGELPPLWAAGGSVWLSEPFLRRLRAHLAPGGIVCLALSLAGLNEAALGGFLKRLCAQFGAVRLWQLSPRPQTLLVCASAKPFDLDFAQITRRMQSPNVAGQLRDVRSGLCDVWQVAQAQVLDERGVEQFARQARSEPPGPRVELFAARTLSAKLTGPGSVAEASATLLQRLFAQQPLLTLPLEATREEGGVASVAGAGVACRVGKGWGAPRGKLYVARRGGELPSSPPWREAWAQLSWPTPFGTATVRCARYDPLRSVPPHTLLAKRLRAPLNKTGSALVPGGGPTEHFEWATSAIGELSLHLSAEATHTTITVALRSLAQGEAPEAAAQAIAAHIRGLYDVRREW